MKASIELALRTREVYQLFERRINGDRLFIEAILHKFNIVMNQCRQQEPLAHLTSKQMEQNIVKLIQQFSAEIAQFEALLEKKVFAGKQANYVVQFRPTIIVTNPLTIQLIKFLEIYDKMFTILKILQLAGCFESDEIFWNNTKRYQKMVNQMLSDLLLTSTGNKIQ